MVLYGLKYFLKSVFSIRLCHKGVCMQDGNLTKKLEELKIHFFSKSTENIINPKYFLDACHHGIKSQTY